MAANPIEIYRSDRRQTLVSVLLPVLLGGFLAGFGALVFGFVAWLVFGIGGGLGPAAQLSVVELAWGLRGHRVCFMPLLQTALDRQVLRQAGAVYQFRHAALQDLLADTNPADRPETSSSTHHCPSNGHQGVFI
jgi:hypothetical protein